MVRDIPLIRLFVAENLVTCSSSIAVYIYITLDISLQSYDKSLMACNEGCFGVLKKYNKFKPVDLKPQNKDPSVQ